MLDANLVAQMVEQEIRSAVNQQVKEAVSQTAWLEDLEQQIIEFVQARIYARFSNIDTVPDLVNAVEKSVGRMFEQGFVPDLNTYVDQERIRQTVDLAIEHFIERTIDSLSIDPVWVTKIENLIAQRTEDRIRARLREIDLNQALESTILKNKESIAREVRKDFQTAGITDLATGNQLTVMDGVVVVEGETVTRDLTVDRDTTLNGSVLIKGSLGVQGKIAVDNETWQELSEHVGNVTYDRIKNDFANELMKTVIESTKDGIDISNITVDGSQLIAGDRLSNGITKSNLSQVGTLESLSVKGTANIYDTVHVVKNRVGINTQDPDSALAIWDEEVNVSAGKLSKNVGFVGTGRKQNLVLGTNRQNHIEIDSEGLTTVQKLRIGRNNISWGTEVPSYSGTKGDIVFNINAGADTPFAWICLGAFRWQSLKAGK